MRHLCWSGDNVEQMVYPVTEIDVCPTAFLEHDVRTGCAAIAKGMTGAVVRSTVCFCFGDDTGCQLSVEMSNQHFSQQVPGDLNNIRPKVKIEGQSCAYTNV